MLAYTVQKSGVVFGFPYSFSYQHRLSSSAFERTDLRFAPKWPARRGLSVDFKNKQENDTFVWGNCWLMFVVLGHFLYRLPNKLKKRKNKKAPAAPPSWLVYFLNNFISFFFCLGPAPFLHAKNSPPHFCLPWNAMQWSGMQWMHFGHFGSFWHVWSFWVQFWSCFAQKNKKVNFATRRRQIHPTSLKIYFVYVRKTNIF